MGLQSAPASRSAAAVRRERTEGVRCSPRHRKRPFYSPSKKLLPPEASPVTWRFGAVSEVKVALSRVLQQKLAIRDEIRVESQAQGAQIPETSQPLIWRSPGGRLFESCLF